MSEEGPKPSAIVSYQGDTVIDKEDLQYALLALYRRIDLGAQVAITYAKRVEYRMELSVPPLFHK